MADFHPLRRICNGIMDCRHPLLTIIAIGIVVRLLLSPFALIYDSEFWALVIRNIEMGQGLYGVEGYYYTPVWGYFLSLTSVFQDLFLNLGEVAVKVAEFIPIEAFGSHYNTNTATVPTVAFLLSVKVPLFIVDLVTALLVWHLVKDVTGDDRKAVAAFALAFLCPTVLMSTAVIAMPDTISAMFTMLTVVLLRKDHPFIAGMTFSIAVLTKFFPVFLIFVLVAYLISKNKGDVRKSGTSIFMAMSGAVLMAGTIFAPQILGGNLDQCFQFLTDRTGLSGTGTILESVAGILRILTYALVLISSAVSGYIVYTYKGRGEDLFNVTMKALLVVTVFSLLYPPNTQYIVLLIPFLAYWIVTNEHRLMTSWWLLAFGAVIISTVSNAAMLMPIAVSWGWFDVNSLLDISIGWYTDLGGFTIRDLHFVTGGTLQCAGILSVLLILYRDEIGKYIANRRSRHGGTESDRDFDSFE